MAEISILKEASPEALADVADLLAVLRGASHMRGTLPELQAMVGDDTMRIIVAKSDKRIVGIAFLFIHEKLGKRSGYVEDVVVSEAARGQGLGTLIMQKLIEEARAQGLADISLTSKPAREAANALYQKLGFSLVETNPYRLTL